MLFSLLKHHLELYITDTPLKVSRSFYCFTTSIFHGVENYFPRLWGTGISDAIFDDTKMHKRDYITEIYWCWTLLCFHRHLEIPNEPTSSGDYSAWINFVFCRRILSSLTFLLHTLTHSKYKAKLAHRE